MSRRAVGQLLAIAFGVVAQAALGWWALAAIGFIVGGLYRQERWVSVRFGVGIALAGAGLLAWLAWTGHPVGGIRTLLGELTGLPVLTLAILLPGLLGTASAFLGRTLGRKVLFG